MEDVWLFDFVLERQDGEKLTKSKAHELMKLILTWTDDNDLQIGGGYRAPRPGEFDGDIFKLK